nr:MAG TPA: hypothetical protein [Caudoviricetes sp.]
MGGYRLKFYHPDTRVASARRQTEQLFVSTVLLQMRTLLEL